MLQRERFNNREATSAGSEAARCPPRQPPMALAGDGQSHCCPLATRCGADRKHRSPGLAQVLIYEHITNIRFPTLVEGNDFHNYLCLEILSCKEVNMSPAEDRNRFPSIISERFVNQSPKLLLVPRGQQGTGRQGRDRPVTFSASRAWARAGSPSPSPVSHMPPSGAGWSRGGLSPDLSSVHPRVRGPQHPWNPLVQGHLGTPGVRAALSRMTSPRLLQPPASGRPPVSPPFPTHT